MEAEEKHLMTLETLPSGGDGSLEIIGWDRIKLILKENRKGYLWIENQIWKGKG